ncbi:MAG: DUF2807 domain-containing protein [Flavobacteriales bacterium]
MRVLILAMIVLLFSRCNKPDAPDCFQAKGSTVTEPLELEEPFHSITIYDNIKLVLTNDTTLNEFYEITGAENLIPDLKFTISDGELTIENNNSCNWVRSYNDFTLYMNKHDVTHVFNYGTEGVEITYSSSVLVLEQQNSLADNSIKFSGDSLTVNMHTGSGFTSVTGNAEYGQFYCNGFTSVITDGFEVENILANNSGAGSMFVTPTATLFAYIGGSGNIIYTGNLVELDTEIVGSGEVLFSDN